MGCAPIRHWTHGTGRESSVVARTAGFEPASLREGRSLQLKRVQLKRKRALRLERWNPSNRPDMVRYMAVRRHGAFRIMTRRRKRRASVSHIRHVLDGTVVTATAPDRHPTGTSRREAHHRPRARKLSSEQRRSFVAQSATAPSANWLLDSESATRRFGLWHGRTSWQPDDR
jgi:hypothetical protein